ncbi:hypothetical protein KCP75_20365 [Salmonella enterica subsp. enterica]|nr:hypothetical protein KCP75_20365 [Salmonella enterica subsp. enterica]
MPAKVNIPRRLANVFTGAGDTVAAENGGLSVIQQYLHLRRHHRSEENAAIWRTFTTKRLHEIPLCGEADFHSGGAAYEHHRSNTNPRTAPVCAAGTEYTADL